MIQRVLLVTGLCVALANSKAVDLTIFEDGWSPAQDSQVIVYFPIQHKRYVAQPNLARLLYLFSTP